jgi:hypothetical protein
MVMLVFWLCCHVDVEVGTSVLEEHATSTFSLVGSMFF